MGVLCLTMRYPLTVRALFERARLYFPEREIVSRMSSGVVRHTYRQFATRTAQLAHALAALGVKRGDRVATFAWNHHRHLEAYFAAPCMGAVIHTLNIRLPAEHLIFIANHAEDKVLLVDEDLLPAILPLADQLKTVERIIVMSDSRTERPGLLDYESLLEGQPTTYDWPEEIDEWETAGICFTSATTGNPKGVKYAHRAIYLHSMAAGLVDTVGVSERDRVMPIVPMFHVNGWGLPFAATFMGASQVLPGPHPTPGDLVRLMAEERVTFVAGVPTVFMGIMQVLEKDRSIQFPALTRIACGGAAVPEALSVAYQRRVGLPILHAYGMTEAAPITHVCSLKSHMLAWPQAEQQKVRNKQGILAPGLEMKILDKDGHEIPWDGKTFGEICLRGPWIADDYFGDPRAKETFVNGWYRTGDIATVDKEGYIQIVDRAKDVIKSGGEWISSVDLENAIMGIPGVAEAAVVAAPHPVWDERPVACVVLKPGATVNTEQILEALKAQFPAYWVPDAVQFLPEIPKGTTGKFDKKILRTQVQDLFTAK
jgi:fatty-acyl-CoA synthase